MNTASGDEMPSIGEGHLPLNLGVAIVTPKLHNGLDVVLSVQSMQEQGYTVVFPPFGGMRLWRIQVTRLF